MWKDNRIGTDSSKKMITQDRIQMIVDGECSHECRRMLLREIESQPTAWRALALALLEEQQWSKQIAHFSKRESPCLTALPTSTLVLPTKSDPVTSTRVQQLVQLSSIGLQRTSNGGLDSQGIPWLTALAACLLLGLGICGGSFLPTLKFMNSKGVDSSALAGNEVQGEERQDYRPLNDSIDTDMKMLVSGPNKETAEIPIYDLNAVDHDVFVAKELYEVARINQRLRKEGFELDVRPEYYTGRLHDGRQLIVPVKHVGVKPYGL